MTRTCHTCTHFRVARPMSQLLARDLGTTEPQVLSELMKIMQDEREVQDAEASQKVELLRIDEPDHMWRCRPQMSDHCGLDEARNIYRIHELKNQDGSCSDHAPIKAASCRTCMHRRDGSGAAEDEAQFSRLGRLGADAAALQQSSSDLIGKLVEQIGATKAFEAVQAYYARRTAFHPPRYLPVCDARSTVDDYVPCSVANPHDRCTDHAPTGAPSSASLLDGLRSYLTVFTKESK